MSRQARAAYLEPGGPSHPQIAKQKAAVDAFIAGKGLKDRISQLQQLPDKQGILFSAGRKHVGGIAVTLHVSVCKSGWCCFDPSNTASSTTPKVLLSSLCKADQQQGCVQLLRVLPA